MSNHRALVTIAKLLVCARVNDFDAGESVAFHRGERELSGPGLCVVPGRGGAAHVPTIVMHDCFIHIAGHEHL